MARKLILIIFALAATSLIEVRPALATSRRNPYSSFNLSGVNYGSQQWQRSHGGSSSRGRRTGGFFQRH